jgi:hypothetical protein
VAGSGTSATVSGAGPGVTTIRVDYSPTGCTCFHTVKVTAVKVLLQLRTSGTISADNPKKANCKASAGGVDTLGPLPMGDGRADFPNLAYTSPCEVVATVSPPAATSLTFRWKRLISRRSWNIRRNAANTRWTVTQRSRRGFPDDDTGADAFNSATPNSSRKMFIYDCSALLPGTAAADKAGDFIYEEKDFTYRVERQHRGSWITCAEFRAGQRIIVRRTATTGVVKNDWTGVENAFAVRTLSATVTEAEVRGIVGGTDPIDIDANANN